MRKILTCAFLITLGTFKPIADLMGQEEISGLGAALNISPSMKVFTAHNGYETFSTKFNIDLHWENRPKESIEVNHELYKKIKGPYNRRNVYGALISYGPLLIENPRTRAMFLNISQNVFCNTDNFLKDLGIRAQDRQLKKAVINIQQRDNSSKNLEINCE